MVRKAEIEIVPKNLFHNAHYNILAAQTKKQLDDAIGFYSPGISKMPYNGGPYYAVDALVKLALSLAKRLLEDNPAFDPLKFLDACSPDVDMYPLSELWEDYIQGTTLN